MLVSSPIDAFKVTWRLRSNVSLKKKEFAKLSCDLLSEFNFSKKK